MNSTYLLPHLVFASAQQYPKNLALTYADKSLSYKELAQEISQFANCLLSFNLERQERVGIYLEKRFEMVISAFGTAHAGAVFVPINPLLKPEQVSYILADCNVKTLVTSTERLPQLIKSLKVCPDLCRIILTSEPDEMISEELLRPLQGKFGTIPVYSWKQLIKSAYTTPPASLLNCILQPQGHRVIDTDMVAILYTSGSTGKPKGVVLSHRNMVAGAKSVSTYLENNSQDTLLAALPLSFDAGFSQLTTAFHVGARVVLINYLLPRDVLNAIVREKVTGLTAVPPLWIQLTQLKWPESVTQHLRYFANTGGRMPLETLKTLRQNLPQTKPYLMYGLTEAFRSTFLPPEQVDLRPDSIGRAIPNAEILILNDQGQKCKPHEPGELVHRGALVGMGYWNDPEKTAERYRPLPVGVGGREAGLMIPEMAVFSGDTVQCDEEGYIYFIGRKDEMIKTSGYRLSPNEVEEVIHQSRLVEEVAVFGVPHPTIGQAIILVAKKTNDPKINQDQILNFCREKMPSYMVPAVIDLRDQSLPRNPNGKIDRKALSLEFYDLYTKQKAS